METKEIVKLLQQQLAAQEATSQQQLAASEEQLKLKKEEMEKQCELHVQSESGNSAPGLQDGLGQ